MDTARGLSKARNSEGNPIYNVTLIVVQDREVKTSDTLHTFRLPFTMAETDIDNVGKTFPEVFAQVIEL